MTLTKTTIAENEALKDFGGVFIETQGNLNINECLFINNTASNISSELPETTDSLLVKGSGNIKIENSHFVKGSFIDEKTNFQVSLLNKNKEIESNNIFLIERCMFSIINPSTSQLYINNEFEKGTVKIELTSFSHFLTRPRRNRGLNEILDDGNYNHICVTGDCIGTINIIDTCFDMNEYLVVYKQGSKNSDKQMEISENLSLVLVNNQLFAECTYPEVIDEIIVNIGEKEMRRTPNLDESDKNKSKNKIGFIVGVAVGALCVIAIIIAVIFIIKRKRKLKRFEQNTNYEDNEDELCQETNDNINSRYYNVWNNNPNQANHQNNQYFSKDKLETNQDSSSSCDTIYEESKWDDIV